MYPVTVGSDGVVLCPCGEPVAGLTSKTSKNPNRKFYICRTKRCALWCWADEVQLKHQSTPATSSQTETSLKRRNSEDSEAQSTPSKRPKPSVNDQMPFEAQKVLERYPGGSQQKQLATPSRTPQQKQRCMQNIIVGLSQDKQSAASSQISLESTPSKPENRAQGAKETQPEDEFDRLLSQEEDPFAPVTGLRTPPSQQLLLFRSETRAKGKARSLNPLQDEKLIFELAESSHSTIPTQCLSNTSPADKIILTTDEQLSFAKVIEQKYVAEVLKNARLEAKIEILEGQINALREERQ
ncbi:hypothetical protein E1B28_000652 [Marasmius oreades]|uniref:GRF-type domain-containing protein n=1 Tax=Marasmius oreades TaxID=181124 RepID=A0A9P8AEK4_9AGAR|nr:uncharacterized protein E1B28_000652 [Marasmius oreades]KAG7098742.1 hypothetical protein E1B28_000652 [Marasmius oreades]